MSPLVVYASKTFLFKPKADSYHPELFLQQKKSCIMLNNVCVCLRMCTCVWDGCVCVCVCLR